MQKSGEKAGVLPAFSLCANGNPVLPIAEKGPVVLYISCCLPLEEMECLT
jgi:hypothetical protein